MTADHADILIPRLNIKIYAFHKFRKEIVSKIFTFTNSLEFRAQKVMLRDYQVLLNDWMFLTDFEECEH